MALPLLVAHRGYTRHYPENTIVGLEAAIRAGARFVEVDVQLTRDGVPVLFHDRGLGRICGAEGAVHDYDLEDLRRLRASDFGRFGYKFAQVRIGTLAELRELLQQHPRVTAFIELKRESIERFGENVVLGRVLQELKPVQPQCVLISYALETLVTARAQWPTVGAVIDRWRERKLPIMRTLHPEYLFCDVDGLPRCGKLRFGDAKIVIYEVDDPQQALQLARRGVDFIETFACGEMRDQIEPLGPEA